MTTEAKVKTPAELAEALLDEKKMAEMVGKDGKLDPRAFAAFTAEYATQVLAQDNGLKTQIAEGLKEGFKDFAERSGYRRPQMGEAGIVLPNNYEPYRPLNLTRVEARQIAATGRGPGTALDEHNFTLAEFIKATFHANVSRNGVDPRLVKNDFSSVVGAAGGDLIPEVLRAELLRLVIESAIVRPRARVIPMDSLTVPFPVINDTSHVSSIHGGILGSWTPESGALTEVDASFGRILLQAKKFTAYTQVPNELIQDSVISFEAFINAAYPEAIAYFEDIAFLNGDGAGQPLGVHNSPAVVAVAAQTGQPTATIVWENIVGMYARMLPASLRKGVWIASIDTFPQLATMSLSVGTGGSAIWLNNGQQGAPMTILGRPVVFTEKVNALGTQGDIGFYDFDYYLIGDRQALSMSNSPHFRFQTDQTVYRFIERVDGRPWLLSALTPHNAGPTLSPFVELASRP